MVGSVLVVNYNGKEYLERCIASILKNTCTDFEIIIIDNNSTDGSVEHIKNLFPDQLDIINILVLDKNYGPARARNEGAKVAKGKYLAFLDNDTQVDPNWMAAAKQMFESSSDIGCLQCKLLLLHNPDKFDYAGEYLGWDGFLVQRAGFKEKDVGQYDKSVDILAAKSAGMFIRKDVFDKIGGFDEDYFIYVEETDLGWRSWLAGYRAVFCPKSVVFHEFSTSASILSPTKHNYNVRFHGTKNYITTLSKNLGFVSLIFILPLHIFIWFCFAGFIAVLSDYKTSILIIKGILWCARHARNIYGKRCVVQRSRIISDGDIFFKHRLLRKPAFISKIKAVLDYYIGKYKLRIGDKIANKERST